MDEGESSNETPFLCGNGDAANPKDFRRINRPHKKGVFFYFKMNKIKESTCGEFLILEIKSKDGAPLDCLFSKEFLPIVQSKKWHLNSQKYAICSIERKTQGMHRVFLGLKYGDGKCCDHINGNVLDNRIENLRVCRHSENMRNRRPQKNAISKFKGVGYFRAANKWQAVICCNGKHKYIGLFKTEEEAARAYDVAAKELHGEFAYLNFG